MPGKRIKGADARLRGRGGGWGGSGVCVLDLWEEGDREAFEGTFVKFDKG